MTQPKKLIEVALPIKEISAESVHDKYIHHGHISTLHIWWARRPLPVCRAVVFASLVPDPLDVNCPQAFKDSIEILLGSKNNPGDPYKPYDDIPFTAAIDKVDDNVRNRLLSFIGKFSDKFSQNEKQGKSTPPGEQLSASSLIKWANKNNETVLNKARKLIWVAYNAKSNEKAEDLLRDFDTHYKSIKEAEAVLYGTHNRHNESDDIKVKQRNLHLAIEAFWNKMPVVFDPFAGGGAIPLESARLGCRSFGNDINPVAHIVQRGGLEFPQKYAKKIIYTKEEFIRLYSINNIETNRGSGKSYGGIFNDTLELESWSDFESKSHLLSLDNCKFININNRLSFDVEFYVKKLLTLTEKEIGHLYSSDGSGNKPIAYFWTRVGTCSNPSCKAQVPLLKQFYLANKKEKKIYLSPIIKDKQIDFELKGGSCDLEGWVSKSNLKCPICNNVTAAKEIQRQYRDGEMKERLIAIIEEFENGKRYRLPTATDLNSISSIKEKLTEFDIPNEKLPPALTGGSIMSWGAKQWSQMFSERQMLALLSLVKSLQLLKIELDVSENDYGKAIVSYLSIWIDRVASYSTSFGRWIPQNEQVASVFGRQSIAMIFDYPEVSIFSPTTSGGLNQLEWVLLYLNSENSCPFQASCINASSGEKEQFAQKSITAVITDPPYYDAIAYADLSDFFYVWLKRSLGDVYPLNFTTPQTPKTEECTALKYHHNDSKIQAKNHFEGKLTKIFDAIEHQTSEIVSVMFAHQSTEAWTTLCNSILGAKMNITGSWAIDSERDTRMVANGTAALQSSVTVSCKPMQPVGIGNFREVKIAIEKTVLKEVDELYRLGFRGSDLLTACFGQAVSEFGKYEKVEKADGSHVTVAELLELARESAFNALLKGFEGDDFTKFYIAWLQLNGLEETDFDDAAKFTKIGLKIDVQDLFKESVLIKNGNKQRLGTLKERIKLNPRLGEGRYINLIDIAHKAMSLYGSTNRNTLLKFIEANASDPESLVWRVVTSLAELLPRDGDDHISAVGLLTNKDQLIREAKSIATPKTEQARLTFE